MVTGAAVKLPKTEVAVGDEGAHAEVTSERQRGAEWTSAFPPTAAPAPHSCPMQPGTMNECRASNS